jgi:hypothetical protein
MLSGEENLPETKPNSRVSGQRSCFQRRSKPVPNQGGSGQPLSGTCETAELPVGARDSCHWRPVVQSFLRPRLERCDVLLSAASRPPPPLACSHRDGCRRVVLGLTTHGPLEKSLLACRDWPARSVTARDFTPGGEGEAEFFEVPPCVSIDRGALPIRLACIGLLCCHLPGKEV